MERQLSFGHLGYGLTVWDRLHEKNGDFLTVAHIDPHRSIQYFVHLDEDYRKEVEKIAATSDMNVSATSEEKVFVSRPKQPMFLILENSGMDNETVIFEHPVFLEASRFRDDFYTSDEISTLNVDIARKGSDGTITTEF